MKSKGHFIVSLLKSYLRIQGCIIAIITSSLFVLALHLLIAELLGIIEEVVDKR